MYNDMCVFFIQNVGFFFFFSGKGLGSHGARYDHDVPGLGQVHPVPVIGVGPIMLIEFQ
jgi:hypothetical protein